MFTLTPAAAEQIRRAADPSAPTQLRVAAKLDTDGELVYGMGFDDRRDDDVIIECGAVVVLIAPPSQPFLENATLDFVEVNPGEFQFVFRHASAPTSGCGGGGCGGCGSGKPGAAGNRP